MDDEEEGGFSPLKYNKNNIKIKSPSKTLVVGTDLQTMNIELLNIPTSAKEHKQTRSLSRGKPQPTSNNLIQKANAINPITKSKLISPRGQDITKRELIELEVS